MTPQQLRDRIAAAIAAQADLARRPLDDVIGQLDDVIAAWLEADSTWMTRAIESLPQATGFSREMIAHGLPLLLAPLRAAAMRQLFDEELGAHEARSNSPLIVHVLSGNIPGLVASPLLLSLALKRAVLVKTASGDRVFPPLFVESIAAIAPELAACTIVADWRGGDVSFEEIAFANAGFVVASGSDAAIRALAARVRGKLIGHGHKVSFAVIAREGLAHADSARELAGKLAYDMALWDQQGCLSPQLCYVEAGGNIDVEQFASLLAHACDAFASQLPPRRLDLEESAAVTRFRQEAEWTPSDALLASSGSTAWSIRIENSPAFLPTCLNRCIRLKTIADLTQLAPLLAPHRPHLEAAGVMIGAARAADAHGLLFDSGVHRICDLGTMQTPGLEWRQGGRPRIAEWIGPAFAES